MELVGFVPEPNCGRGTITIVWTCLSTIFLAIWVAFRPTTRSPEKLGPWLVNERWGFISMYLLMPTTVVACTMNDWWIAMTLRREMRGIRGWDEFSLKQAFLLGALEGVYIKAYGCREQLVTRARLVRLARANRVLPRDFPTDDHINFRSNGSGLLELISISQTLWFLANIAYRLKGAYKISLLEDITVPYALCGLLMFFARFRYPQVVCPRFVVPVKMRGRRERNAADDEQVFYPPASFTIPIMMDVLVVFTGFDLTAWNHPFASVAEAWTWRVCSIALCVFVVVTNVAVVYDDDDDDDNDDHTWLWYVTLGAFRLCVLTRLATLVLAFMAFRESPVSIYEKPSWSAYWMHLG